MSSDIVTMMLLRWPYGAVLRCYEKLVCLLDRPALPQRHFILCDDECEFARHTLVHAEPGHWLSFHAYSHYVLTFARDAQEPDAQAHLVTLMRACFLVALVGDVRWQRFVYAHHDLHQALGCVAADVARTDRYRQAISELVYGFLAGRLDIGQMTELAVEEWEENYSFRNG